MGNIKLFEDRQVRTTWSEAEEKWYFVVEDVVAILTDSKDPKQYIKRLRQRDEELAKGWVQFVPTLTVETAGGKQQMNCADLKGILRIIQSIPSPKAEPFKRWLAQVGSERIEEIENPEIATQRTRELYKLKGYPDDWIEKRMRSIAIREELTEEWKNLELIFSMLGEASTTAIVRTQNPKGFVKNKQAARQGGKIAGDARKALEMKTGESIVSEDNFLPEKQQIRRINRNE